MALSKTDVITKNSITIAVTVTETQHCLCICYHKRRHLFLEAIHSTWQHGCVLCSWSSKTDWRTTFFGQVVLQEIRKSAIQVVTVTQFRSQQHLWWRCVGGNILYAAIHTTIMSMTARSDVTLDFLIVLHFLTGRYMCFTNGNRTEIDTDLNWSTEFVSGNCCYHGYSLFTTVIHVQRSVHLVNGHQKPLLCIDCTVGCFNSRTG